MALDRATLAKIDRRVFAELAHTPGVQVVKVPVSDAVWSTWRRYCDAIGLTMGEGVAGLVAHELETVAGDDAHHTFAEHAVPHAEERTARLDAREGELDARATSSSAHTCIDPPSGTAGRFRSSLLFIAWSSPPTASAAGHQTTAVTQNS